MIPNLKYTIILSAGCLLIAGVPPVQNLPLIEQFNDCVRQRFQEPLPEMLGMSRVAMPSSFGTHFRPDMTRVRDFLPESAAEREILGKLEQQHIQLGMYVFGASVATSEASQLNFRALKGPAAMTAGTPRPAWYPLQAKMAVQPDALPDWKAIYPVARTAMQKFRAGNKGFETHLESWDIVVRPSTASQERCVACHNNPAYGLGTKIQLGDPIGGVIYASRATPR